MVNLAIKGHATRGKEVIEILEMLGGINTYKINYTEKNLLYRLREGDNVVIATYPNSSITNVFTLERFLEKFPYKVGDKVQHKDATSCGYVFEIEKMRWEEDTVKYKLRLFGCNYKSSTLHAEYLQPYKEEIIDTGCCSMPTKPPMYKLNIEKQKDTNKVIFDTNSQCCDISNKIIEKETMEKEISGAIIDRFICLEGYDFYDDKGNIIDTKEIIMKKKKPKYPKTFVECAKMLDCFCAAHIDGYYCRLLEDLQALLICRDAYWKIAGALEPEYKEGVNNNYYTIHTFNNKITLSATSHRNAILAFPTEEMRDAFYENFKKLIEECKELL